MVEIADYQSSDENAWCPGCGNFGILSAMKQALVELELKPEQLLLVSGIGQAAKLPHYLKCNTFNGLHGRTLPVATGVKIANHNLVVIAVGGDGDGYAEGGNHFIHAMRRNVNITYIVHDNQVYGLTKGQSSPTTDENMITGTTPRGVFIPPEKPLALAVASGCSFVARGFVGEKAHLVMLIKEAIKNEGFSFIDVLQPCVTFNKINTYKWYKERVYKLDEENYKPDDPHDAFDKASEWGKKIPIGIIYRNHRLSYEREVNLLSKKPLVDRSPEIAKVKEFYKEFY